MKRTIHDLLGHTCLCPKRSKTTQSKGVSTQLDTQLDTQSKGVLVSASETRNYMLHDTLVDWLKYYYNITSNSLSDVTPIDHKVLSDDASSFYRYILQKGIEFEHQVIRYINDRLCRVIKVSDVYDDKYIPEVLRHLKKGEPILYQVPLKNDEDGTYGIADIVMRSDMLWKIFRVNPLNRLERRIGCDISSSYHYVVIDIKYSTLTLRSDGIHLLNSNSYPAYKAQLCIYNRALGKLQGYTPSKTFILGRRWSYTSKGDVYNGNNCFDRLGVIDYDTVDKDYLSHTDKAISWIKDIKQNAEDWSILPPSKDELYPNMKVDSGVWNRLKKDIATQIGDLTQIWHCGYKNRLFAFERGIYDWRDRLCCSLTLNIPGKRGKIVDRILEVNRGNTLMLPTNPKSIVPGLKGGIRWSRVHKKEYYIDFETISDVFDSFETFPVSNVYANIIFLIGVGWYDEGFKYKSFICNTLSFEEEARIVREFLAFVRDGNILIHWSGAEGMFLDKALERIDDIDLTCTADKIKGRFMDLCEVFTETPIVIKGCFSFSLKQVAKAMYSHGMINTTWDDTCHNGMDCSLLAWKAYKGSSIDDNPIMTDILRYNEADCKVMYEILSYLRCI